MTGGIGKCLKKTSNDMGASKNIDLDSIARRLDMIEDWMDTVEKKNIDFTSIELEIKEIKNSIETHRAMEQSFDNEVLAHIRKVESDFYDNGKGLKYDIINMLRKFEIFVERVTNIDEKFDKVEEQITYQGRRIIGVMLACLGALLAVCGTIVWFIITKKT